VVQSPPATTREELARSLLQFTKVFRQIMHQELQRHFTGGNASEFAVLHCLKHGATSPSHAMRISEISKLMRVTSPAITQVVKRLEAAGLVQRHADPTDRRIVGITMTTRGEAVIQQAEAGIFGAVSGMADALGEAQSQQFAELLCQASRFLQEHEAQINGNTPEEEPK
jgi:DNA-binding MarR family transcriptional regulator